MSNDAFWSTLHHLGHPWAEVITFYWSRYPNPNSGHVYSEDMLECKVGGDGKLRTKRIITKTNGLPWWGKKLFATRRVALIEESIVDPVEKTMTTYTRNIGLRLFMGVTEKCTFGVDSDNPQATKCNKQVWISSDLVGLRAPIKKFGIDRFKTNCVLATEGLRWAIQNQQSHVAMVLSKPSQGQPPHLPPPQATNLMGSEYLTS